MSKAPPWRIDQAQARDLGAVRALMEAYAASLGIDLDAQGFGQEIAHLPGPYAPPHGALLLAFAADGPALGMIALKPLPRMWARSSAFM